MANSSIQVVLREPGRVYRPGELIAGVVHVRVHAECKCDGLDVAVAFFTHGKGNTATKQIQAFRLFVGTWAGGTEHQYPFEIPAPRDPLAYQGTLLNVAFRIEARADVPWAIDPKSVVPVAVQHDPPPSGLVISWNEKLLAKGNNTGCLIFSAVLLGLSALVMGIAAIQLEPGAIGLACPLGIFGIIGLAITLPRALAERKLGAVEMGLRLGGGGGYREPQEEGQLFVSIKTQSTEGVSSMTATLEILEQVVRGSGSNATTHRHPLHSLRIPLVAAGNGHYEARVPLPPPGQFPYSFSAPSNQIIWRLTGHVDIAGWPDWKKVVPLTAKPGRARV